MPGTMTPEELNALTDVLKEHLTNLRGEILETDDAGSKQMMRDKEEVLRTILLKFERQRQAAYQLLRV